jgi:ligand-binding sensor domain-containing protein
MIRYIFLLLIAVIPAIVSAEDIRNWRFEHLTVNEGLSQNTVEEIFQDSRGYMWFATKNGVNLYDGLSFRIFRYERDNPNSMASSWVNAIAEDLEGNIWIGSDGLNVYNTHLDELKRIPVDESDPNAFHGGKVYDILIDGKEDLWAATSKGLMNYNLTTGICKTYSEVNGDFEGVNVYTILIDSQGRMFIGSDADPIYEFNKKTQLFTKHDYKTDLFGANYKKNISLGNDGNLYIASEGAGLHIYNPDTKTVEFIGTGPGQLNGFTIKTGILPISEDEIIICVDGGGINVYNITEKTVDYIMADATDQYSIGDNAIISSYKDIHGNIWLGHYGAGISLYKKHKFKFRSYFHNPFDSESISNGVVTAVYQDKNNNIWIGLDGGGLSLFNPFTQKFTTYKSVEDDESSLSSNVIVSITENSEGYLLLGTYAGGLMVFDPETGTRVKTYDIASGLSANHVWDIAVDRDGNYWLATLGGGFDIFNPYYETFRNFIYRQNENVCSDVILSITSGPDGNMWFATETSGICVLNSKGATVKRYAFNENDITTISSSDIRGIEFSGEFAWVATNGGGLNKINYKTNEVKVYTIKDGLSSNSLMGIQIDKDGILWISSIKGLMKFDPKAETVVTYDKNQGLQGNEFRYNAQYTLFNGTMLFGGSNGLTVFHPNELMESPIVPNIILKDLKIYNKSVVIGGENSPLEQHINFTENIKLKHNQRVFTIEFAALDYTSPERNLFQYKMDGFDEEWVNSGNRNDVTYTNLSAGKYTFRLRASNSDGVWSDKEKILSIVVRPPWYKTKAFIAFVIIFIIVAVWNTFNQREKKSKLEKEILQRKINEGQAIIDSKLAEIEQHQEEIRAKEEQEIEIRFHSDGLAKFSIILADKRKNLEELAFSMISELVKYLEAQAGAIYVAQQEHEEAYLLMLGHYCFDSKKASQDQILAGEGLVGTSFVEKRQIISRDLPDGFIVVESGLGNMSLRNVLIEPLMDEDEVVGAFEIASLKSLPDYKIEFVKKLAGSFASVLAIESANKKSQILIEENKIKTEEILAQEEELRQNLEELKATQEMSQRKEEEMKEQIEKYIDNEKNFKKKLKEKDKIIKLLK